MTTQITRAFLVTSALTLSLLTTGVMPVATTYAASKGAQHRSSVADSHSNAHNETALSPVVDTPVSNDNAAEAAPQDVPATKLASATTAAAHSPAGNNGFIKVNEETLPDSIPNNDPHVSCQFKVEFYNYDQDPAHRAQVSFALHNPTAGDGYDISVTGNQNPIIGGDAAGGGNDLDAVETYRLNFTGQPHAKQGYHVKLTIHADGSKGADVKHKVFWVQPCEGKVLGSTDNGTTPAVVSATKESAAVLPTTLPSTGTNPYGFVITLIAAGLAYVLTYGASMIRGIRTQV